MFLCQIQILALNKNASAARLRDLASDGTRREPWNKGQLISAKPPVVAKECLV